MRVWERPVVPPGGPRSVKRGLEAHLTGSEWSGGPSGGLDWVGRLSQRATEVGRLSKCAKNGREAHPVGREVSGRVERSYRRDERVERG